MAKLNRLVITYKALNQLGFQPVALNALYRFGLATGHYRRVEKGKQAVESSGLRPLFTFPAAEELLSVFGKDGKSALLAEADEIVAGKVRLFGMEPVQLSLALPGKLEHWSAYETGRAPIPFVDSQMADVKFLWEPARFGWAFTLGRAFHLSGDDQYARAFWQYFETFTNANQPCLGPHWMSGQEVALRLMAFVWAAQVFDPSPASTPERKSRLAAAVSAHAARIPPTLVYARSQQNNHLLTESAALLTAGLALPDHPSAARWLDLGWRWLNQGLRSQIDGYGEYAQHSTNYHRLMLQVALWTNALARKFDLHWPHPTLDALKRSIHWLLSLLDFESGQAPNLGGNDGAYIFPLTVLPFSDYRPVVHAAARAFINYDLPPGPWDEMALWIGIKAASTHSLALPRYLGDQLYGKDSWACLRTAQFTSRPSHADQLHLDLWWRGLNVARDPGTYLYNAPAPWDNSLATALVHNTVTVDGKDQFTRAGRFLYLDWANAYRKSPVSVDPTALQSVSGRYRRGGYRHTRTASIFDGDRWRVEDEILPLRMPWVKRPLTYRLHWLLPDWKWEIVEDEPKIVIRLQSPHGWMTLGVTLESAVANPELTFSLARAGEILAGTGTPDPIRGWMSPSYGTKVPALSLAVKTGSANEVKFVTEFNFPK